MGFDWSNESREKYYQKVEKMVNDAGFGDFIKVDRTKFGLVANRTVKVYVEIIHRRGNQRRWWEALRTFPDFKECPACKDLYGRKQKGIYLRGYFEIDVEANVDERAKCDEE